MAPPEGKILLPPTGCPGMGPGEGQELGSSTKVLGAFFVPSQGTEQPQDLLVSPHSPAGQCPGSCPHSLRFHFPFIPISGGARSRWNGGEGNGSSCCWPLVASASDTTATQGWCRGANAAPGSAAGSAWGGRGTPQGSVPHRGGTQHHAQSPRIHPGGITWEERTQKPSCSPCTPSLSQQNCSLPRSLSVGTALF